MNATAAKTKMQTLIDTRTTAQLFADLRTLRASAEFTTAEGRITHAMICDTIEARENLTDALDEIYADDNFAGTYLDALQMAYLAN